MEIAIETLLTLIAGLLPEFGVASTSVIAKIIAGLETIMPIIISGASSLITAVQSIIATLQSSGNATPAQLASLAALDAQCDAAFEAAASAAGDPAPSAGS